MKKTLHVLFVQDSDEEVLPLQKELRRGNFEISWERAYSSATIKSALSRQTWDIIVSNYELFRLSGMDVMKFLQEDGLDTPLIIISEYMEENDVVAAIKQGAQDFILKSNLARLAPAVEQCLKNRGTNHKMPAPDPSLHISDERLKLVLEGNNAGLWEWNIQSGQLRFSPQWATMLGFEEGELEATLQAWASLIHPEDRPEVQRVLNEHLEGNTPYFETEHRIKSKSGEWIWILNRGRVIERDGAGEALRAVGTYNNISKRKLAESGLYRKTAEFETIFKAIPDAVMFVNINREISMVNPAFSKFFGYTLDEVHGKSEEILYADKKDFEKQGKVRFNVTAREKLDPYQILYKKKNGEVFFSESVGIPVKDGEGRTIGFLGIIRDISARKKAQEALKESDEKFRASFAERKKMEDALRDSETNYRRLFEENLTGNFVMTAEGELLTCNPAFARIFGFPTVEEAMEANFFSLHLDPQFKTSFLKLLNEKKKLEFHETEFQHRDGHTIYVVENVVGVFDDNGKLENIRGYLFDDTRRREIESQFMQAQKMESLGTLAGSIAHDFNNLLSVITANSEILLMKMNTEDPLRKAAEQIKQTSRQAAILTNQILTFSRKQVVQPRVIDMNKVVENVSKILLRLLGKDIEMNILLNPELGKVRIDPVQIEQILINLAVNARDAMPGGGKLTIGTNNVDLDKETAKQHIDAHPGPYVLLAVSDTGTGMDPKIKEKIFEPFFTTKKKGKGTGLGLATVYGIVKQNKGFIDVHSELGKGSIFKVYLPIREEE